MGACFLVLARDLGYKVCRHPLHCITHFRGAWAHKMLLCCAVAFSWRSPSTAEGEGQTPWRAKGIA